ncbi:MAG: nucleotidyltransferase domain-containing protein [Phycisphaerae bacterium]
MAYGIADPLTDRLNRLVADCLTDRAFMAVEGFWRDGLWSQVVDHACSSGVGGVVARSMAAREVEIPRSAAIQLDSYRQHVAAATAYSLEKTEPALECLEKAGIPFLVLKGAALNAALYDGPGLRPMIDVDLLIRPADAGRADVVLRGLGCRAGLDLLRDDYYPRYYYEREYFLPCRPEVKIDLHVRPFRPLRYAVTLPDDAMWDKPMPVSYGRLTVQIPNVENMLIHLAVHAACHGAAELKWLYDLKLWLDRYGSRLDIEKLVDKCQRWKIGLPVRVALEHVDSLFGESSVYLQRTLSAVKRCRAGWRDRLALAQSPRDAAHPLAAVAVNVLSTPGIRFRLGYLRAVLLPARSHLAQVYRGRHPGWPLVAHAVRIGRHLTRRLSRCRAASA